MSSLKPAPKALRNCCITLLALFLCPVTGAAQNLSGTEIDPVVQTIAKLIEDHYVFPDKGKRIAAHLRHAHRQGRFARARHWEELSVLFTTLLRDFSGDGHLYVRHDPGTVKELSTVKKGETGAEEENAFFHGEKAREKNYGIAGVQVLEGNIGYIKLSEINISEKSLPILFAAMQFVSGTRALIVDLRDNGGGGSEIGPVIESFFLPKNTTLLEFRRRDGEVEVAKTVPWLTQKKYDGPVYIIINKGTASAAEAMTYALQMRKRAQVVGQPSAGAAHMNSWYVVNAHLFVSISTGAPTLPGTEESWEGKGVRPDHLINAGEEIEFVRRRVMNER